MLEATERPSEGAMTGDDPTATSSPSASLPDPGGTFLDPSEIDVLLDRTQSIARTLGDAAAEATGPSTNDPDAMPSGAVAEPESIGSLDERLAKAAKVAHDLAPPTASPLSGSPPGSALADPEPSAAAPLSDDPIEVDLSGFTKPATPRREAQHADAASSPSPDADVTRSANARRQEKDGTSGAGGVDAQPPTPSSIMTFGGRMDRLARRSLSVFAAPLRGLSDSGRQRVSITVLTLAAWAGLSWAAVLIMTR